MQRTFNYTNRKKIGRSEVNFSLMLEDDTIPSFTVAFNFGDGYPENASIYVEVHAKETRQRFYHGTISQIVPPGNSKLNELDLSAPTLFDVLVVDESGKHGLIIASGTGFRAEGDTENENKSSLLPVVARPLRQQTWKIEMETGENGKPELILNSKIPDAINRIRTDPHFQSLILPAALREVIVFFLWDDDDSEENEIRNYWMKFAEMVGGEKPDSQDPGILLSWVNDVVDGFSERFNLCDLLCAELEGDSQ